MNTYRIAKWAEVYETAESKRHKTLAWISMPISFGSHGYQSLVDEFDEEAPRLYGAWCALVAVAAQAPERGVLASSRGKPFTVARIARMTCFPAELFTQLIEWASSQDVRWLEVVNHPEEPQTSPSDHPQSPQASPRNQTEVAQPAPGLPNTTLQNPTQLNPTNLSSADEGQQTRNERASVSTNGDSPVTPNDVVSVWNDSDAPAKVSKLTGDRLRKLKTRLRDRTWPWREAIAKLPIPNDDKFDWQPDFDWLIRNETNALSIVEGKFDRDGPKRPPQRGKLSDLLESAKSK